MLSTKHRCHINKKFSKNFNINNISKECTKNKVCNEDVHITEHIEQCECDCGDGNYVIIPFSNEHSNRYDLAKLFASTSYNQYIPLLNNGVKCRPVTKEYNRVIHVCQPVLNKIEKQDIECPFEIDVDGDVKCKKCNDLLNIIGKNGIRVHITKENNIIKVFLSQIF